MILLASSDTTDKPMLMRQKCKQRFAYCRSCCRRRRRRRCLSSLMSPPKTRYEDVYPGGYPWEFLEGVCRPVLQIPTLFQTRKFNFPQPFSDQTSKIHTRFQTWAQLLEADG